MFRWVEEDPKEILQSVYECMERTCEKLTQLNIDISNIKGIHVPRLLHESEVQCHFNACQRSEFLLFELM